MTDDTNVQPETQPAEPTSAPAPPTGEAPAPDRQPGQWTSEALEAQIRRQHRKIKELEQQMQRSTEIEGENRRLREQASASGFVAPQQQQSAPAPAPAPQPNMAELEQQVAFKLRVDDLGRKLEREYGEDWKLAFTNYQKVGVLPPEVLAQAMETDDPAYVLVTLGKDPMKIQEVLDMPPYRRMATLVRMADAKPKPAAEEPPPEARLPGIPRPSNAPPPPTGERQRGNSPSLNVSSVYDERLNFQNYYNGDPATERAADDAYYALRRREKLESTGRPWSIKK